MIGNRYFFEDIEGGVVAQVTEATVLEPEKRVYVIIRTEDDRSLIISENMTDLQLQEYRAHKEAYFGEVRHVTRNCENVYEFFQALVETHGSYSKEQLLNQAKGHPDIDTLSELPHQDLLLELCERWAGAIERRSARHVPGIEPVVDP